MDAQTTQYIDVLQECLDTKWNQPKYPQNMYKAADCPACDVFGCYSCPIQIAMDTVSCVGTPCRRDAFGDALKTKLSKRDWTQMVKDERAFLHALIDHLKAGHAPATFKETTDYDWRKDANKINTHIMGHLQSQ